MPIARATSAALASTGRPAARSLSTFGGAPFVRPEETPGPRKTISRFFCSAHAAELASNRLDVLEARLLRAERRDLALEVGAPADLVGRVVADGPLRGPEAE